MMILVTKNNGSTTSSNMISMNATDIIDYIIREDGLLDIDYNGSTGTFRSALDSLSNFIGNKSMSYPIYNERGVGNNSNLHYVTEELNPWADYEVTMGTILLGVFLSFLCLFTICGNILVMAAVIKEPYLHTVTNYFIASLATADFIVGAVVMPFCIVLEVTDDYWPFGQDWCDGWRSTDVLASTASILNLCVIAVDRYWAITDSISYPTRMSPKRAGIIIAIVWICSSLISFPAIAWWRAKAKHPPPEYQCLFTEDPSYLVFSSIVSFFAPLFVMLTVYYKIYRAAIEQKRSLKLGTKQVHHNREGSVTLRMHRGGMLVSKSDGDMSNGNHRSPLFRDPTIRAHHRHTIPFSFSKKISKLAKERKAAKTLGIVMGVFILCWLPFFVTNVLKGLCSSECVASEKLVFSIVTWLGWANSGMNPVIYALWSRDFRRAYLKLLCSWCPRFIRKRFTQRTRFRQVLTEEVPLPHLRLSENDARSNNAHF